MENIVITDIIEKLKHCEINIYLVKFDARSEKLNNAVLLPDDINSSLLKDYNDYLYGFINREVKNYNPNGNDNSALPVLNLSSIEKRWDAIYEAINSCGNLSQRDINTLNTSEKLSYNNEELNLYVTEIKDTTDDSYCYFVSKYQNTQKVLKYKRLFLEEYGRFKEKENTKALTLNYNIDVVILNDNVYVLSETRFNSIFDYDENLKETAMKTASEHVSKWKIFYNADKFMDLLKNKYAYRGIAKISKDTSYLNAIEAFDPKDLKSRILDKCRNVFSEEDFKEDLLNVTKKNGKKIINLISKELKYNIFEDKVEE